MPPKRELPRPSADSKAIAKARTAAAMARGVACADKVFRDSKTTMSARGSVGLTGVLAPTKRSRTASKPDASAVPGSLAVSVHHIFHLPLTTTVGSLKEFIVGDDGDASSLVVRLGDDASNEPLSDTELLSELQSARSVDVFVEHPR